VENQRIKKDLSNKQQLSALLVIIVLFFAGTLYWMDHRPAFIAVENNSTMVDSLKLEMRSGFTSIAKTLDTMRINMEHIPRVFPVANANLSRVSSKFGWRVLDGDTVFHKAIDISAKRGTAILASASGTVIEAGYVPGFGNYTVVDNKNGVLETYGHQDSIFVVIDQEVRQGQKIGTVGNTGNTVGITGYHLDFRVLFDKKSINPALFFL
jgi:murein DD-endopeptidase MepM/ murein hydrolase activator NlpD